MNMQELLAEVLDHIRGMWRYRWIATALAWVVALAGILYVYSMPDVYRASAQVYVDTENVLRPLMANLMATDNNLNDVQLLSRTVTRRENLEAIAYATDLDLRAKTQDDFERLISDLEDEIGVSGGRDNIFTLEYTDPSRQKAIEVVQALTNTFIEGALTSRGDETELAEHALLNEIQLHEAKLAEDDERLEKFKRENLGFMPDQYGDYYSRLQAASSGLAASKRELELALTRRDELRRQINGEDPVFGLMPGSGAGAQCTQRAEIDAIEEEVRQLGYRFTEAYPPLANMQKTLETLRADCKAEIEELRASGLAAGVSLEANPVYQNMQIQLTDIEVVIAALQAQVQAQQSDVDQLLQNVDRILAVEKELKQLNLDRQVTYDRLQEYYKSRDDLQAKKRVEPVADTAQFVTINQAFADPDPSGPNRGLLISGVLLVALGAGGALAFVLNQIYPVFFTREKLKSVLEFPVIGSVTMLLPPEVIARRRMEAATWSVACVLLLAMTGVSIAFASWAGAIFRGFLQEVSL